MLALDPHPEHKRMTARVHVPITKNTKENVTRSLQDQLNRTIHINRIAERTQEYSDEGTQPERRAVQTEQIGGETTGPTVLWVVMPSGSPS